ncbi:hypothetical protein ACMFMG_006787 [Clarireedia jacksonii]
MAFYIALRGQPIKAIVDNSIKTELYYRHKPNLALMRCVFQTCDWFNWDALQVLFSVGTIHWIVRYEMTKFGCIKTICNNPSSQTFIITLHLVKPSSFLPLPRR